MILVLGKNGQVAQELWRLAPVTTTKFWGRDELDLRRTNEIFDSLEKARPSAIVNTAAFTNVDAAEENISDAFALNRDAPKQIAILCQQLGIPLIHLSTDYVYDGQGDAAFKEDAKPAPLNVYGQTKLSGESVVIENCDYSVILRTSWIFSVHGTNFVKTMLGLGNARDDLQIVGDQIGAPTSARSVAIACLAILVQLKSGQKHSGIYNFASDENVSWAEFASEIFQRAMMQVKIKEVPSDAFPRPAIRPKNSRLCCDKLIKEFGLSRPNWRQDLGLVLDELKGSIAAAK